MLPGENRIEVFLHQTVPFLIAMKVLNFKWKGLSRKGLYIFENGTSEIKWLLSPAPHFTSRIKLIIQRCRFNQGQIYILDYSLNNANA